MSSGNRFQPAIVAAVGAVAVILAAALVVTVIPSGKIAGVLPAWLQWGEGSHLLVEVEPDGADLQETVARSMWVIERRLYELGGWATVKQQGPSRIVIRLGPSLNIGQATALATRRGRLEFRLIDPTMTAEQAIAAQPPQHSEVLYDASKVRYLVQKRVWVSGRSVLSTKVSLLHEPVVRFLFDEDGTRIFGKMTEENLERALAVVLDGRVLMAPVIKTPIPGGMGYIAAGFTIDQAMELSILLRGGELPARVVVVEQRAPVE